MSPRTKEQYAQIRKRSSDLIMESALVLFAKNGFHQTSIGQIAEEAGISKGLIYNYFENKDDLLRHIVEHALQMGDDILEDQVAIEELTPLKKIYVIIDEVISMFRRNPRYWKLIMMLSMKEDIAKRFKDLTHKNAIKNLGQITKLLKQMKIENAELEAMCLAATFDGILLHFIHFGNQYPLEEMATFIKMKIKTLKKAT